MTGLELLGLLQDPATRQGVQALLGLPSEPVAEAMKEVVSEQRELRGEMRELAAAQTRTEIAVRELAAAQARTDDSVRELREQMKELAAAQARTDESVARLADGMAALRHEVGRLSDNVGFGLEELAAIVLPDVLARRGVRVERFDRRFFVTSAGEEEVDLYAEGERDGERAVVVGETKARIYTGDVQKFEAKAARVAAAAGVRPVRVIFGFVVHPKARVLADSLGIDVVAVRPAA